jgi:CHAT domain-containing protein/tetratricopeptide (TPR) repeat protein
MSFRLSSFRWVAFGLGLLSCFLVMATHPVRTTASQSMAPMTTTLGAASTIQTDPIERGRNQYRMGRFAEAVAIWQQAAQQYQRQGDALQQALSLSYLSLGRQELSQWSEAQQAIAESLALLQKNQPTASLWAQVLNTEASLLLHQGKAETALDRWQQAQKYYQQANDMQGRLGSQINQAQALQQLGFYRRSRQQLEAIVRELDKLPDTEMKISGLRALGLALANTGDVTSGDVLQRSLLIAQKLNSQSDMSATLLSLGRLSVADEDFENALNYFEQAERSTTNPTEQLQSRLSQLQLLIEQGQSADSGKLAIAISRQIQQQLQDLEPSRTSLYTAINFVATLNDLENPSQLVASKDLAALMSKVVKSARQIQDASAEAYALNQWGQLYERTQQFAEAQTVTEKSLQIARNLQADNIISQSAWQMGRIAKQQNQRSRSIAYYQEAVKSLQAIRADLIAVNQDLQFSYRESVEPVYRELVELLVEGNPGQTELLQARDLIESLQVAELDNFFREACLDKARQIDQVDPTATVVYPIILPDHLAVILSTAGQPLRYYSLTQPQAQTDATIAAMYRSLSPVADSRDRLKLSQQLYDWLIRPAASDQAFKDTKTLVFVLDGRLRNIPMSALHDGQQYLIEKYAVTLSPGLQLMASRSVQPSKSQAIIGGISDSRAGFAALPGVETEVKTIAQSVASSTLLNQAFTGEALAEKIKNSNADIVHLATHGQFSSRLEDTFLLTWDGRVNVKELSEYLRSREGQKAKTVELLVLSACDTATGDDRAALGLAGLAVKSGARSTIATLWPVKDKAAALLMTQFYDNLKQNNSNKAEALRQAQLHLLQKTDFREPFFWSGVVLVGNWQ